ncbi:MAG: hypothetical protein M1819_005801 [Sarea resinae]|nr:MAG: hypothetical protein M1819_005801 [Sarea resinae]
MVSSEIDREFPCSLVITVPLPTHRLASSAMHALAVDKELSPLVQRSFSLSTPEATSTSSPGVPFLNGGATTAGGEHETVLKTEYRATTNRMLRVAVNGFMESLTLLLGVMEDLDVDVLGAEVDDR